MWYQLCCKTTNLQFPTFILFLYFIKHWQQTKYENQEIMPHSNNLNSRYKDCELFWIVCNMFQIISIFGSSNILFEKALRFVIGEVLFLFSKKIAGWCAESEFECIRTPKSLSSVFHGSCSRPSFIWFSVSDFFFYFSWLSFPRSDDPMMTSALTSASESKIATGHYPIPKSSQIKPK